MRRCRMHCVATVGACAEAAGRWCKAISGQLKARRRRISLSRAGHGARRQAKPPWRCTSASRRDCTSTPTRPGKSNSFPPRSPFPRVPACGWMAQSTRRQRTLRCPSIPRPSSASTTGEFVIQARIVAAPGDHLVEAKLRYQACDKNACMPPRTITVAIDVIGK